MLQRFQSEASSIPHGISQGSGARCRDLVSHISVKSSHVPRPETMPDVRLSSLCEAKPIGQQILLFADPNLGHFCGFQL